MEAATLAMACSPEEHCLHRIKSSSAAAGSHSPFLTGRLWATAQPRREGGVRAGLKPAQSGLGTSLKAAFPT